MYFLIDSCIIICCVTGAGEDTNLLYDLRLSETVFVDDGETELVDRLSNLMNWLTGLHTREEEEDYELLQLASYGSGGFYKLHLVGLAGSNSNHILDRVYCSEGGGYLRK